MDPSSVEALTAALIKLKHRQVPAFEGDPNAGVKLARSVADALGLEVVVYTLKNGTQLPEIVGDYDEAKEGSSGFHRLARDGGVFVVHVPQLTKDLLEHLPHLTPFLPEGAVWRMPHFAPPWHFEPNPNFYLIFCFPDLRGQQFSTGLSARLAWIVI